MYRIEFIDNQHSNKKLEERRPNILIGSTEYRGHWNKYTSLIIFLEKQNYDLTSIKMIYFGNGNTESGLCKYPWSRKILGFNNKVHKKIIRDKYEIRCTANITYTYPRENRWFVRPIFEKNDYGVLDMIPQYDTEISNDNIEQLSWLLGHELFHFLRKTKQIEGQNTQSQANVFGFKFMREFKKWKGENYD
jgi:hypothetical protein